MNVRAQSSTDRSRSTTNSRGRRQPREATSGSPSTTRASERTSRTTCRGTADARRTRPLPLSVTATGRQQAVPRKSGVGSLSFVPFGCAASRRWFMTNAIASAHAPVVASAPQRQRAAHRRPWVPGPPSVKLRTRPKCDLATKPRYLSMSRHFAARRPLAGGWCYGVAKKSATTGATTSAGAPWS
jgi:hypothetical protein